VCTYGFDFESCYKTSISVTCGIRFPHVEGSYPLSFKDCSCDKPLWRDRCGPVGTSTDITSISGFFVSLF
jgi:hypothetical protein